MPLPQTIPPVSLRVAPLCCDLPSPNPGLCRSVRVLCAAVSPSQLGPAPCPKAVGSPAAAQPLSLLVLVGKTPLPQPVLATGRWKMSEVHGLPRSAGVWGGAPWGRASSQPVLSALLWFLLPWCENTSQFLGYLFPQKALEAGGREQRHREMGATCPGLYKWANVKQTGPQLACATCSGLPHVAAFPCCL